MMDVLMSTASTTLGGNVDVAVKIGAQRVDDSSVIQRGRRVLDIPAAAPSWATAPPAADRCSVISAPVIALCSTNRVAKVHEEARDEQCCNPVMKLEVSARSLPGNASMFTDIPNHITHTHRLRTTSGGEPVRRWASAAGHFIPNLLRRARRGHRYYVEHIQSHV